MHKVTKAWQIMKYIKGIIILFLVFAIIAGIFIAQFIVKVKVTCKSQFGDCPASIVSDLQKENSKTLFKAKNDINKLLKNNYLLTEYSQQFKLPGILVVNILERKPAYALDNQTTSEIWLIDSDGTVLSKVQGTTLPKVIVQNSVPKPGEKVDSKTFTALKIIQGVWEMYQVSVGEASESSMVVNLPSNINVIFPLDSDPEISLGALRLIYTKITTGDNIGKYQQIDLRFKNPVLR